MEETTTPSPAEATGAELPAQPVQPQEQEAVQPQTQTAPTEPSSDDNLDWLKSKGVDPSSPEAVAKLAEMYRNAEKQMHQTTQKASELERAVQQVAPLDEPDTDPAIAEVLGELRTFRTERTLQSFKQSHPDWEQYDLAMGEALYETTPSGESRLEMFNRGQLTLDDIYALVKGRTDTSQSVRDETRQQVLQQLANTQRAGGVQAHATDASPEQKATDPILEGIRRARESR